MKLGSDDCNSSSSSSSSSSIVVSNEGNDFERVIRIENPFTFKTFQVFTGFGVGCGLGIGVGSPLNLGAVPMVGQVMSAARGATDAFSGVSRHVNGALWKLGAKNIKAGVGCGVGFGHGFGVGLAVKPRVVHQIQSCLIQASTKLMMKFGIIPSLPVSQSELPLSLESGFDHMITKPSNQNPIASFVQQESKVPNLISDKSLYYQKGPSTETPFESRTEKVLNSFLQNPILNQEVTNINDPGGRLGSENEVLQMVLKHQLIIEQLMEENGRLKKILVDDLKVPSSKLESSYPYNSKTDCSECFECRRKQRRSKS